MISTTNVRYENNERAEKDAKLLNDSAKEFKLVNVKYKVLEREVKE